MKKSESETAIRNLIHVWKSQNSTGHKTSHHLSFMEFRLWLDQNGYSNLLDFKSVAGPIFDAEQWFDAELRQVWQN